MLRLLWHRYCTGIFVDVKNITFQCGKAEALIPTIMNSRIEEPVAIVDPPRAGLSKFKYL